ncbi:hypothetical protein [Haliangium sp.]|uniref:hypothetical protein n=1 Tax=Haliangium sp. TaxID=2663208 RepID=UPI003D119F4F
MKTLCCAALSALALLLMATCGGKSADTVESPAAPAAADAWLAYIPADSPLVMANLRPLPPEIVDWLATGMAPIADNLQNKLAEQMAQTSDEQERAVLAELDGKLSREGLASIGVSLTPRYALYGIGVSLAVRVELANGQAMRDFIARLEAAAGEKAPRATFEDIEYLTMSEDELRVVLAVQDDVAIFGVMPEAAHEQVLPVLFGKQKPERSLADTGALRQIVDQYGLLGVATGYLDTAALARLFTGRGSALSTATMDLAGIELPELSAVCHKEIDTMAAAVPRLVFGYTGMRKGSMEALGVLEMRADLAGEMAGLQRPVVGLNDLARDQPVFAMGLGLDLAGAMDWLQSKAQAVADAPYQCPELAELNQGMTELATELGNSKASLPPFITGFQGLAVAVTSMEMGGDMPNGTGYALLGVKQPMQLIGMAQAMVPQLSSVTVEPDGAPVPVSTGVPVPEIVNLTVQGDWIGAAIGDADTKALVSRMRQKPKADGPFMVMSYNYAEFTAMLEAAGGLDGGADEIEMMKAVGRMMGFVELNMRFEANGLYMKQRMTTAP